ncbi:MAG: AsmA family protein [Pseudomonadota bacterium]
MFPGKKFSAVSVVTSTKPDRQTGGVLKWVLITLLVILCAVTATFLMLDSSRYRQWTQNFVKQQTGRELHIEGPVSLVYDKGLQLVVEKVRFQNAKWAESPWALEVSKVLIDHDWQGIFNGKWRIRKVLVEGLDLDVVENAAGGSNWDFNSDKTTDPSSESGLQVPTWLQLDQVIVQDATVSITSSRSESRIEVDKLQIDTATVASGESVTQGQLNGRVDGISVDLTLETADFDSLVSGASADFRLDALLGQAKSTLRITGNAEKPLQWQGVAMQLDGEVLDVSEFSRTRRGPLTQFGRAEFSFAVSQPDSFESMSVDSFNLQSSWNGVPIETSGQIDKVVTMSGLDLQLNATGPVDLEQLTESSLSGGGSVDLQLALTGSVKSPVITVEAGNVDLPGGRLILQQGDIVNSESLSSSIRLRAEVSNLSDLGTIFGLELPALDAIDGAADLVYRDDGIVLKDLRLTSTGDDLDAELVGNMENLDARWSGELKLTATSRDLSWLSTYLTSSAESSFSDALRWVGQSDTQLDLAVALNDDRLAYTLNTLQFRSSKGNLSASGQATADLGSDESKTLESLNLSIEADVADLHGSPWLSQWVLPHVDQTRLTADLVKSQDTPYTLQNIQGQLISPFAELAIKSGRAELSDAFPIEAMLELDLRDWPDGLESPTESTLDVLDTAVFPLSAKARYVKLDDAHSLQSLRANGEDEAWALESNVVDLNRGAANVNIQLDADVPNSLIRVADRIQSTTGLAHVSGSVDTAFDGWKPVNTRVDARLNRGDLDVSLNGSIRSMQPLHIEKLNIDGRIDDARQLTVLEPLKLQQNVPLEVDAQVSSDAAQSKVSGEIRLGESDLSGDVSFLLPTESHIQSTLVAELTSSNLDLVAFRESGKKEQGPQKTKLFSSNPLPLEWLERWQGRVGFEAGRFTGPQIELDEMALSATFGKGQLDAEIKGQMGSGEFTASLANYRSNETNQISIEVLGAELDSNRFVPLQKNELLTGGKMGVDINLSGAGTSIAEIAAGSNGSLTLWVNDAETKSGNLDLIGGDLFSTVLETINPFDDNSNVRTVECGALHFNVRNGVASNKRGFAFRTNRVTVLGGGSVDLRDEKLSFALRTKARKGFGINTNSVAKLIRLGGTLSSPEIQTDGAGLLQSGVAIGAAIASGGLSLIAQGLFDRSTANSDVCSLARDEKLKAAESLNSDRNQ